MQIIAAYVGEIRHVLEDSGQILSRANQALATLERYKLRLDEVASTLSALEIEDLVTVRDVAVVAQRLEMVTRIAREIEDYVLELGTDGRLLSLQLEELVTGVDAERELVIRDYLPVGRRGTSPESSLPAAGRALGHRAGRPGRRSRGRSGLGNGEHLDGAGRPARLPAAGQGAAAARRPSSTGWSTTSAPCRSCSSAGIDDLQAVEGVGELRARSVREGLSRLAESSILGTRYVLAGPVGLVACSAASSCRSSWVGEGVIRSTVTTGPRRLHQLEPGGRSARRPARPRRRGSTRAAPTRSAPSTRRRSACRSTARRALVPTSRRTTTSRVGIARRALPARPDVVGTGGDLHGHRLGRDPPGAGLGHPRRQLEGDEDLPARDRLGDGRASTTTSLSGARAGRLGEHRGGAGGRRGGLASCFLCLRFVLRLVPGRRRGPGRRWSRAAACCGLVRRVWSSLPA